MSYIKKDIRKQLIDLADENYRIFTTRIINSGYKVLGVRLPILRNLAKKIAKDDWQAYLKEPENEYFEEVMLQGMIIGFIKTDAEEIFKLISDFVPRIENWSVCDSFCSGLKFTRNNKETVWNFIQPYLSSSKEYYIRFGVVMMLDYFIDDKYINSVLKVLDSVRHDGYYAKMAVAWTLSVCFIKQQELTMNYFKNNTLDDFTYNKALQKIIESYRIDDNIKNIIRGMKRK